MERIEKILHKYNQHYALLRRNKTISKVTPSFSLTTYENDLINEMADTFGVNKSEFVRVCIHYFATAIKYKQSNNE